jgi:hypothetical protein
LNWIVPINVAYERLVRDPQAELNSIALELALPDLRFDPGKLRFKRQANETNRAWRSRFLQEGKLPRAETFGPAQMQERIVDAPQTMSEVEAVKSVEAVIVAHLRNTGDVTDACGTWIGASDGRWIEGFSILTLKGIAPNDVEYYGVDDFGCALPWASGGAFSGTRGAIKPLRGFCVRLHDEAARRYECSYSGRFQDGSVIRPVQEGLVCKSPGLAPLEAFQIVIRARRQ